MAEDGGPVTSGSRSGFPIGASASIAELEADPHALLAALRGGEPVSWLPSLSGWLVTSHELAERVLRDPALFTVDDPRFSTARVVGPSMLSLDGEQHARHREPFTHPFRPAEVRGRFTAVIEDHVERLLTAMRPKGAADLRAEFAGPLAVAVVAEALGLTDVDAATVLSWYAAIVEAVSEVTAGRQPGGAGAAAMDELKASVLRTLAERDPASILVAAGERLSPAEVIANAAVLMFGGIDTTEGMITNAVLHLLDRPDLLAAARSDEDLLPAVVEESVRLEPAAAIVDRYATADVELGGAPVGRGDLVTVSISAANRDPAVFPAPDTFDPHRPNARRNLAFAKGPHFCIGAQLARTETLIALREVLRLPDLAADSARPSAPRGLVFRKPAALHVTWSTR
ncbi:cytochrome P450 [Saccharomonospora sp. NPDC006951]